MIDSIEGREDKETDSQTDTQKCNNEKCTILFVVKYKKGQASCLSLSLCLCLSIYLPLSLSLSISLNMYIHSDMDKCCPGLLATFYAFEQGNL